MPETLETMVARTLSDNNSRKIDELNVEPGMNVSYPKSSIDISDGTVSKIIFNRKFRGGWEIYIEGIDAPFHAYDVKSIGGTSEFPKFRKGEPYELNVEAKTRWRKKSVITQTKTRIIAQSSLEPGSTVYLMDNLRSVIIEAPASYLETVPKIDVLVTELKESRDGVLYNRSSGPQMPYPSDIADEVGKVVLHQENAINSASIALFDHMQRPPEVKKSNVLIVGPTGTGKTAISRTLAALVGVPFEEAMLSLYSSSGYKSENLNTIFRGLYNKRDDQSFNYSLFFLDEIDKLAPQHQVNGGGFGQALQNEIIGWSESAKLQVEVGSNNSFSIDTTNFLFIAAGAFSGIEKIISRRINFKPPIGFSANDLVRSPKKDEIKQLEEIYQNLTEEDLFEYGMMPELIGRFPVLTYTKPLNKEDIIDIMKNGAISNFKQQVLLLQKA